MTTEPSALFHWLATHGASQQAHSGRTLLDHLRGTWEILQSAEQARAVCLGGLFHSVYGTNVFKAITVPHTERLVVQALIGSEAEALVWAFGQLQRPRALAAALDATGLAALTRQASQLGLDLNPRMVADLQAIECANLLEQGELWKVPALALHAQRLGIVGAAGFAVSSF